MADTVNKELFLDILTKEEREALLTKKMEEIRKKNEALRKRHEEIEADKRVAAKNNPNKDVNSYSRENSNSGTPSPRKESKPLPGEVQQRSQRPARSTGRGRPPPGGRGKDKEKEKPPQPGDFRVIRWEPRLGEMDITHEEQNGETGNSKQALPTPKDDLEPDQPSKVPPFRRSLHMDRLDESDDDDDWEPEFHRSPPRRNQRTGFKREDLDNGEMKKGGGAPYGKLERTGMLGPEDGPPPDPSYNFLSDRRREGMGREAGESTAGDRSPRKQDMRRHPKNFGGKDFNNVKAQMRSSKERQERPKSGPPRTKMDLAMVMTGKERKQYMEWKAERERVDQERLDRQKSNTGEWRRAWDAEKHQQDFEQPPSPQRTEPAKRPAGRIGSGRFDRGEREDRQRGDTPRQKAGVKTEQEAKPVGRGRARGRGRGRARGASPRQRTFSDESRKVERQKDLLVVMIDNSGKNTDQSVEVEYWDDDLMDVRSNSAASVKSASSREGHSSQSRPKRHEEHQFDDHEGQKHDEGYRRNRPRPHSYSHSENEHDESWEDCPEDADYYVEDDYINVDGDDMYNEPLKLDCKLNPDAPEFTPTSPEFMKTPPGLVKVMDWVAEVNTNLSPTSPPPTMDGVDNAECKKLIFKGGISDSPESKQSSSHGGVTKSGQVSEEELSASHKDDEVDDDDDDIAAPDAADEFLDASGDLDEESSRAPEEHDSQADKVSTPTHQIYSLMPGKTDDAELSDEPHADEDKSSIKSLDSKSHVKEASSSESADEQTMITEGREGDLTDCQTEVPKDSDETSPAAQGEASAEDVEENLKESSSEEAVQENPKESSSEAVQENLKESSSEETVQENHKESSSEAVQENLKESSSEEAVQENPKESKPEEAVQENPKESSSEAVQENLKESSSEEAVQENPKESSPVEDVQENPKESSSEEAVQENPKESSSEEAVQENPKESSSEEAVQENPKESSSEEAGEVKNTTEVVQTSKDQQPEEQMAEMSLNSRSAESVMAQSEELGHINAPTEEKSSASDNVVKPETPPPANTAVTAEDSHVE